MNLNVKSASFLYLRFKFSIWNKNAQTAKITLNYIDRLESVL